MNKAFLSKRFEYKKGLIPEYLSPVQVRAKSDLEEKIEKGRYRFEKCSCFCGGGEDVLLAESDYYGVYYPLVICKNCGLIRANPRLDSNAYSEFYDKEYRRLYGEGDMDKKILWEAKVKQGEETFNYIKDKINEKVKVVYEIGCNMGATLYVFKKNGFDVAGVDYGGENIGYGKEMSGIESLYAGGAEELIKLGRKADLVILVHVFEHFLDLGNELRHIRKLLNPGGYLYVAVPGTFWWIKNICAGDIMGLLQNAHTYQFSFSSLNYVLQSMGFEAVAADERIQALFKMTDKFLDKNKISEGEFEKILKYLKGIERRYQIKNFIKNIISALGLKNLIKQVLRSR